MGESETAQSTVPKVLKHGLSALLKSLSLDHSKSPTLHDAVLVSIDFEGLQAIQSGFFEKEDSQVGLAILDTKELPPSYRLPRDKLISTFNFATGSPSYVEKASRRFLFGETVVIQASSMAQVIRSLIPDRNVVLVGYNVATELRCLRELGFVFDRPPSVILDTARVAYEVLRYCGSLRDMLLEIGCEFKKLHSAGNDAYFTLKALLLLGAKWCIDRGQEHEVLNISQHLFTDYEVFEMLQHVPSSSGKKERKEAAELDSQSSSKKRRKEKGLQNWIENKWFRQVQAEIKKEEKLQNWIEQNWILQVQEERNKEMRQQERIRKHQKQRDKQDETRAARERKRLEQEAPEFYCPGLEFWT